MRIDSILAEIRSELSNYDIVNKIDELSIYKWAFNELKRFGMPVMVYTDDVIEAKNGKATLPENFHALILAQKCIPLGYECDEKVIPHLQNSLVWKERIERTNHWDSCDFCCKEESEKIITENIYVNEKVIKFHYQQPIPLKLVKGPMPNACLDECQNRYVNNCPYEIKISGNVMFTNFDGYIYIEYKGVPVDEEGKPEIKDTDTDRLREYMEYFLKFKMFEKLFANGEENNIQERLKYFLDMKNDLFRQAMTDCKMSDYDSSVYKKMELKNRMKTLIYELPYLRNL